MIFVDRRDGAADDYVSSLQRAGSDASKGTLMSGDFAIPGFGPGGASAVVGVELKKLGDLMRVVKDGRLVGSQLPMMRNTYDVTILVVQGVWRRGAHGAIEVPRGRQWETPSYMRFISYDGLKEWLNTKRWKMGIRVEETHGWSETVRLLREVERWWTSGWDSHKSDTTMDVSGRIPNRVEEWQEMPQQIPTLPMHVARQLPGLGDERARAAGGYFRSVTRMVGAGIAEWEEVPGVGPKTAADVYAALRREF
jgi:ERCC4-type nuclease